VGHGGGAAADQSIAARVSNLIALARNDEAARLLGLEGVLEGQLDITFLDDPLDWIAYDIAQAIKSGEEEGGDEPGPTLATLVAELRLVRALKGDVDEIGLNRLVREYVEAEEG
jgi:hypothetical protein